MQDHQYLKLNSLFRILFEIVKDRVTDDETNDKQKTKLFMKVVHLLKTLV